MRGNYYLGALMTYEDYMSKIVESASPNIQNVYACAKEIFMTKDTKPIQAEIYMAGNKTFYSRFASDSKEIKNFLQLISSGSIKDGTEIRRDMDLFSIECLEALNELNIDINGQEIRRKFRHEKIPYEFKANEVLSNFNGASYEVLEIFGKNNLFLKNVTSGEFCIGINCNFYEKSCEDNNAINYGIEWDHGIYLGKMLSEIDIKGLKQQYSYSKMDTEVKEKKEEKIDKTVMTSKKKR